MQNTNTENAATPVNIIFWELGNCIAENKEDFVELLKESGVTASMSDFDDQLAEKYVVNVPDNKELLIGSAYLCAYNSSSISFSGDKVVSNDQVHGIGRELYDYFSPVDPEEQSDFDASALMGMLTSAGKDIGGGAMSGGPAGAYAGAAKAGFDLAGKVMDGKNRKLYGGLDLMQKQQEAKSQMIQAALAAKKAEQEALAKKAAEKAKTRRIIYISVGVGAAALLTVATILIIRSSKRRK
tara:strand:+ start:494 stop:1213 length:720 start_codon:yes stop_codon:yes gene_type:complete